MKRRHIVVLIAFALICLFLRLFVLHTVRITGVSMEGTLNNGDIALVSRLDYAFGRTPRRGDITECTFPGRSGTYVKRVIGIPGDDIRLCGTDLFINGVLYSEPYADGKSEEYTAVLGDDEYLVLGDNRAESHDGRSEDMGLIHRDNFIGRICFILYPPRTV